jgi:hypothetical protein
MRPNKRVVGVLVLVAPILWIAAITAPSMIVLFFLTCLVRFASACQDGAVCLEVLNGSFWILSAEVVTHFKVFKDLHWRNRTSEQWNTQLAWRGCILLDETSSFDQAVVLVVIVSFFSDITTTLIFVIGGSRIRFKPWKGTANNLLVHMNWLRRIGGAVHTAPQVGNHKYGPWANPM